MPIRDLKLLWFGVIISFLYSFEIRGDVGNVIDTSSKDWIFVQDTKRATQPNGSRNFYIDSNSSADILFITKYHTKNILIL